MVAEIARDPQIQLPISGIGGIQAWQDAVEFMLLGSGCVQVCTAVMHYGFRIVEHLISGLGNWMTEKGYKRVSDIVGLSAQRIGGWSDLDLNYKVVAQIDQDKCIHCGVCYIACEDGCHQSIRWDKEPLDDYLKSNGHKADLLRSGGVTVMAGAGADTVNIFTINQDTCVGCNMCSLICPVTGCINMQQVDTGKAPMSWRQYQELLAAGRVDKINPPEHA